MLKHVAEKDILDLKKVGNITTFRLDEPSAVQVRMISSGRQGAYVADVEVKTSKDWTPVGTLEPQDRGSYRCWVVRGYPNVLYYTKLTAAWYCAKAHVNAEALGPPAPVLKPPAQEPPAEGDLRAIVAEATRVLSRALDQLLKPSQEELPVGVKRIDTREVPAQNA